MNLVNRPFTFVLGFIILLIFLVMAGYLILIFVDDNPEPLYVDCESHPAFYLIHEYYNEEGFFYADIDDLKRIVYVGGGVFVGAE
jgi:hypothetical protein